MFLCVFPVEVCEAAGRQSAGSAVRAAEILRTLDPSVMAFSDKNYGYTVNQGFASLRYYGWRLSRNASGRMYDLYLCSGSSCTYQGYFSVKAQFNLNGRQVRDIRGEVLSYLKVSAEVKQSWWCRHKPSTICGEHHTGWGALARSSSNVKNFSSVYLSRDATYDQAFQIAIRTHPDAVPALTPVHDALDFRCVKELNLIDPDHPGECYYPGYAEGDAS